MEINLTTNELKVLISLLNNGDMYGLEIVNYIKAESGSTFFLGSLYNVLAKLENKGFVESYWGDATAERGGNRRRYYKLTGLGKTVIEDHGRGMYNLLTPKFAL